MYGVIAQMKAVPGRRAELAALLAGSVGDMAGCLSYVVAEDLAKPEVLWITEVWADKESHDASLELPAVREAIAKARPLIAGFGSMVATTPVGGFRLGRDRD